MSSFSSRSGERESRVFPPQEGEHGSPQGGPMARPGWGASPAPPQGTGGCEALAVNCGPPARNAVPPARWAHSALNPGPPHPRVLGPREVKKRGSTLILNEWGTSEKKGGAVGCMETGGGGEYGPEVTVALGGRGDCQLHSSVPHPHPRSSVLEPLGPVGSRCTKPGWRAGLGGAKWDAAQAARWGRLWRKRPLPRGLLILDLVRNAGASTGGNDPTGV